MSAIVLDDHRNLFRNDADFDHFVSIFQNATQDSEMKPIWAKKRHLATLLSPAEAKTLVQNRMLKRILGQPTLLDEMKSCLENDDIVE